MRFLIEDKVFEDDQDKLLDTLEQRRIEYSVIDKNSVDIYAAYNKEKTFCYGSLELINKIKQLNNPKLITSCTIENYDCRIYYNHFSSYSKKRFIFNGWSGIVKAKYIDKHLEHPKFVRPAVGYKPNGFNGGVYTKNDIDYIKSCFHGNDELMVSTAKFIDSEYRIIIDKYQYITGCTYKTFCEETRKLGFDPSPDVPDKVKIFIELYFKNIGWYPDDIYVVDLVEDVNDIALLEINALSTSGWYDCDYNKIIDSIIKTYD